LWDATTGEPIHIFEGRSILGQSVAFFPDGVRVLAGTRDGTLKTWDTATGQLIRTFSGHSGPVRSLAVSRDGLRVVSGSWDMTAKLWDAVTGQAIRTFAGHSAAIDSVALSPDGKRIVTGSFDKTLRLWSADTGELIRALEGHLDDVYAVSFSPDGTRVLSASGDKTLRLWDASTGGLIRTFEGYSPGVPSSVAFSPDGTSVLSAGIGMAKLWDVETGRLTRAFEGHWAHDGVWAAVFSPDGTQVLSGSQDMTLKLWNTATGHLIRTFEGHVDSVTSIAFSADGSRLVSTGGDTSVKIWDAATGQLLVTLLGGGDNEALALTPAGFFTGSRKGTEMLSVVRGLESYSVMQFYDHLYRPDLVEELLKGDPEGKYKSASRTLNLETILDSGPAPRIELLPKRTEKSGETVKLAARLVDAGGGIGPKVIWRVNGRTQGTIAVPRPAGPPMLGDYIVMEQTLTVDPSNTNEVEIVAYNGAGRLATPPLRIPVDAWGPVLQERPRLFVLALGIDKYARADWQLRYATKDASAFADALKTVASARVEGKTLFADIEVKTLRDAEVTERAIAAEFDRLSGIVKARDVFVLFVGGHGRSIAGEGWFYIPQDFDLAKGHTIEKDAIGPGKLAAWLAKVPAQKSLIVLDACESGASDAFRSGDRAHETVMAQLEHATGRNTIAAAPAGKAAYEGYNGHGVLTYAILEALNRPDGAPAQPVSVFGIAQHISLQVPAITQRTFGIRQQPRFIPTGDDFSLGLRQAVLKDLPALMIPTAPTHINPKVIRVFKDSGGKGGVTLQLQPFTPVAVVRSAGGWAQIARDGKILGYVQERGLQKLAQ
jgi:WD40 repeat protein